MAQPSTLWGGVLSSATGRRTGLGEAFSVADRDSLLTEIDWISDNLAAGPILLERFLSNVADFFDAEGACVVLHDPGTGGVYLERRAGELLAGAPEHSNLREDPMGAAICEVGTGLILEDGAADSRLERSVGAASAQVGPLLVVPFQTPDVAGHLKVMRGRDKYAFTGKDLTAAGLLSRQLAASLSSARQMAREQKRVAQLSTLTELTELVSANLEIQDVKRAAIEAVISLMHCEAASLLRLDDEGRALTFDVAVGEKGEEVRRIRLAADEGIAGWVVQNDQYFLTDDVEGEGGPHSSRVDEATGFETRQVFAVPLRYHGRLLGCLQALNTRDGRGFDPLDLPTFQALANQVAVALENARLHGELRDRMRMIERQQEALVQSEKLSAMGQLSAGVAHEIRSPLSAISGYAQLLRRRFDEDERLEKPLNVIEDATHHINRIVNGLLDFARQEEPSLAPIDVEHAIVKALDLAEHTLSRYSKVRVVREFSQGLPKVVADLRQLQQVFLNLMLNAAQAMPRGGDLTIKTFAEPAPGDEERLGRVVILFTDTGEGIPEDNRKSIFQPFFTDGKERGTGLGLSICRSIVQNHRGAITFETETGKGTTFRVQLPVDPDHA